MNRVIRILSIYLTQDRKKDKIQELATELFERENQDGQNKIETIKINGGNPQDSNKTKDK